MWVEAIKIAWSVKYTAPPGAGQGWSDVELLTLLFHPLPCFSVVE